MNQFLLILFIGIVFQSILIQASNVKPTVQGVYLQGPQLSPLSSGSLSQLGPYPRYPELDTLTFDFGPIQPVFNPENGIFQDVDDVVYIGIKQQSSLSEPYFTPHDHPRTGILISMNGIQETVQPEECLWEIVTGEYFSQTIRFIDHDSIITNIEPPLGMSTAQLFGIYKQPSPLPTETDGHLRLKCWVVLAGAAGMYESKYSPSSIIQVYTEDSASHTMHIVQHLPHRGPMTEYQILPTDFAISTYNYDENQFPTWELKFKPQGKDLFYGDSIQFGLQGLSKVYTCELLLPNTPFSYIYSDGSQGATASNNDHAFAFSPVWTPIDPSKQSGVITFRITCRWSGINPSDPSDLRPFRPSIKIYSRVDFRTQFNGVDDVTPTIPHDSVLLPMTPRLTSYASTGEFILIWDGTQTNSLSQPLTLQFSYTDGTTLYAPSYQIHATGLSTFNFDYYEQSGGYFVASVCYDVSFHWLEAPDVHIYTNPLSTIGLCTTHCAGDMQTDENCDCRCLGFQTPPLCTVCSEPCLNGGVADDGCTECLCDGFWVGQICEECGLQCEHNGLPNSNCTQCIHCDDSWTGDDCNTCGLLCPISSNADPNDECTACTNCIGNWIGETCQECSLPCENGTIVDSCLACSCHSGWGGLQCDQCLLDCGPNGHSDENCNQCICDDGFGGGSCQCLLSMCPNGIPNSTCDGCESCNDNWSGTLCDRCTLSCANGGVPDEDCTKCMDCDINWGGDDCGICSLQCPITSHAQPNDECTACTNCIGNWIGDDCSQCPLQCPNNSQHDIDCLGCECIGLWGGANCDRCTLTCLEDEIPNNNCTACIPSSNQPPPCELICQHNGIPNNDCTKCINCDEHWMGKNCDQCQPLLTCLLPFITDSDNTCSKCINPYQQCENYYGGNDCQTCNLICYNNGKIGINCDRCICTSQNYNGAQCQCRIITYTLRLTTIPQQLLQQFQNNETIISTKISTDDNNNNQNDEEFLNYIKTQLTTIMATTQTATTTQINLSTSMRIDAIELNRNTPPIVDIRGRLSDNCQLEQNNFINMRSIWNEFKSLLSSTSSTEPPILEFYGEKIPVEILQESIPTIESCNDDLYHDNNIKCDSNNNFNIFTTLQLYIIFILSIAIMVISIN